MVGNILLLPVILLCCWSNQLLILESFFQPKHCQKHQNSLSVLAQLEAT